jgi:hypothetical protein
MSNTFNNHLSQIDSVMGDACRFYYIKDLESRVLFYNKTLLSYLNYKSSQDVTGLTMHDIYPMDNANMLIKHD